MKSKRQKGRVEWKTEDPAAEAEGALHSPPATLAGRHSPLWVDSLSAGAGTVPGPRTLRTIGHYLLYSVGYSCLCSPCSFTKIFHKIFWHRIRATCWPGTSQTKGCSCWVQAQWDKETPSTAALTALFPDPQPQSRLNWGILCLHRRKDNQRQPQTFFLLI